MGTHFTDRDVAAAREPPFGASWRSTRMVVQSRENECSVCRVAKPALAFAQDHCATATVDLVLTPTLKGPRLAPGTRLKIDLEDHGVIGVSGQQPHPIFRPERVSPQGYQVLKSGWSRRLAAMS